MARTIAVGFDPGTVLENLRPAGADAANDKLRREQGKKAMAQSISDAKRDLKDLRARLTQVLADEQAALRELRVDKPADVTEFASWLLRRTTARRVYEQAARSVESTVENIHSTERTLAWFEEHRDDVDQPTIRERSFAALLEASAPGFERAQPKSGQYAPEGYR